MSQLLSLLLGALILWPAAIPQNRGDAPPAPAFHMVSYVEVAPVTASRMIALEAFKEYQAASRKEEGFLRFEVFEQEGRPGHFAFIETWQDQKQFDARVTTTQRQLTDKLQSIRLSDIDRRPYKTLAAMPESGKTNSQTVYVITHVDVSPNPQVAVMLQRQAEESRRDDGNIRFDVLLHTMRANHFTVIEAWRNQKALDAHAAAAHTKQYRDQLAPMLGSPLDERVFESVQP